MSAAKILWGQVLPVALIILLSIWSATQWTASALGYQPELGEPWFGLFGQPIYRPYDLFWWWFSYDAYAPHVFNKGGMIATSGGFVAIIVAIAMSVAQPAQAAPPLTGGSGVGWYRITVRPLPQAGAATMLGGDWIVDAVVEHGEKRGRTLGFPTANMQLGAIVHPAHGIYAVWAREDGETSGRPGVANFGRTPTTRWPTRICSQTPRSQTG